MAREEFARPHDERGHAAVVADGVDDARRAHGVGHGAELRRVQAHGLLAQNVLARARRSNGEGGVRVVPGGDDHGVNARIGQQAPDVAGGIRRPGLLAHAFCRCRVHVARRGDAKEVAGQQMRQVHGAQKAAAANQPHAHAFSGHVFPLP